MSIKFSFGKYEGKTISYILDEVYDAQYLQWLLNQDWFKEKYPKEYKAASRKKDVIGRECYDEPEDGLEWYDFF